MFRKIENVINHPSERENAYREAFQKQLDSYSRFNAARDTNSTVTKVRNEIKTRGRK